MFGTEEKTLTVDQKDEEARSDDLCGRGARMRKKKIASSTLRPKLSRFAGLRRGDLRYAVINLLSLGGKRA